MYSVVIRTAIDVIRAVLLATIEPTLGFNGDNEDDVIAEQDPVQISEKIRRLFFLFKHL